MKKEFTSQEAKEIGEALGVDFNKIDLEQFRMGLGVELEHGTVDKETNITNDNFSMTGKIAWIHIKEIPDYYTRLKKMEKAKSENMKLSHEVLHLIESFELNEFIKSENGKFVIYSHKGKKLGEYPSRKQAVARLRQIEWFKRQG